MAGCWWSASGWSLAVKEQYRDRFVIAKEEQEPTVTDAHAVLGRVGEKLLGGKMHLDVAAARKAIEEKLAVKLNMTVEERRGNSSCSEFQHGQKQLEL